MPRLRKLALWIVGAVALYAVLGFLVAPPIVRHQLEKVMGEQLGRRVAIERVRINPFALSASIGNLAIKDPDGGADMAGFEDLSVNVSLSSLLRLGVVVEAVTLTKPFLRVTRLDDKTYSFQDILDRFASAPPAPAAAPAAAPRFAVYNIQVSDGRVDFDDRPAKTQHAVTEIEIGLPFVSALPDEVDIVVQPRLAAKVNGAPFAVAGDTKPFKETHEAALRIDLDQLEVAKYLEYVPLPLRVRVPSGSLTTRLVLTYSAGRSGKLQTLVLSGTAALQRLVIRQADGAPLAALGNLGVDIESVDLLRRRAVVRAVRIEGPELDIVREKDGSLNLQNAFPPSSTEPPAKPAARADEPPIALTVGEVALLRGQVRFADRSTPKPVRLSLGDISLLIKGLSSAPDSRADLKLTARINRKAPVEVTGKLNVLGRELFADLLASERDIELLPMSPYSEMYAGYAIAQGKVSLKHVIRLQDRKLGTENSIRVEQFDFGEKVDSPTATSLPVKLAVAVLKDRDGVIAVNLPISASLDDPEAGGGRIIRRELGGFVDKAAETPFALLGGEDLAYLEFAPGSVAFAEGSEAKLKKLVSALDERPELKLEISGRAIPDTDGADLPKLAQARAQAVRDWLVNNGKLAAGRASIGAPRLSADGIKDKGKPTRVDLALR